MNLLIGLAVYDIQGLQREGHLKQLRNKAHFLIYLEDITRVSLLLNRWLDLEPLITVELETKIRRAKGCTGQRSDTVPSTRLRKTTIERALTIAKRIKAPPPQISITNVTEKLTELSNTLSGIREMIENLKQQDESAGKEQVDETRLNSDTSEQHYSTNRNEIDTKEGRYSSIPIDDIDGRT